MLLGHRFYCCFYPQSALANEDDQDGAQDILTPFERSWLKAHPQIYIGGDPHWPPFEMIDKEGEYQGVVADYITLLEARLGFRFQRTRPNSWSETLADIGNNLDVIAAVAVTPL